MVDLQQVIDESRPMIEAFLRDIGIYEPGQCIVDAQLLNRFSKWLGAQDIQEDNFWFLVSRVGAFICEYLIGGYSALRYIDGKRIMLRLPVDVSLGAFREFDPYAVAVSLVREKQSLEEFLNVLADEG